MAPAPGNEEEGLGGSYPEQPSATAGASSSSAAAWVVRRQDPDGNCLFRSCSDQMYGSPDHHSLLRDRCSKYLACERDYFQQFVAEPFDDFLARIQREGECADDVEIQALSEMYDCRIEIYASRSHALMRTFHETCEAKWPHPIRLQYEGCAHYNSLAPREGLRPVAESLPCSAARRPGEIEDAAIERSRRRREAGQRRAGAGDADVMQTDREVLDESIRLSRLEFEHRSEAEMDKALEDSRKEWEKTESKRVDDEVVEAVLQQSVQEEEQKQLKLALKESEEMADASESAALYGVLSATTGEVSGTSSSAARGDSKEYQYPESVYAVMSMGFPLDKCIQAYHLVGDNPEGILAYCCQTIGR